MEDLIQKTREFVREELEGEGSGHDWWHIERVTKLAKEIASKEGANTYICQMAALLHDLADEKLIESEEAGLLKIQNWLTNLSVHKTDQNHILYIIKNISFKGGHGPNLTDLEAKIVQDADRLDAIGAIGIARCFTYAGSKGSIIYNPEVSPRTQMSKEEYRNNEGTAINHFYEKLLKLKDMMNTETGKTLAEQRHRFMESYLDEFFEEWSGKK